LTEDVQHFEPTVAGTEVRDWQPPEPPPAAAAAADPGKLRYLLVSLAVVILDQWTKWLVELHLAHHVAQPIVPNLLNLTHVRNTGVAFGLFASHGLSASWVLTGLGLVALSAVSLYFGYASPRDRSLLLALALVVGGAVGNLIDRIASGAVTDFIDVYVGTHHWPSFNVADAAISVGIVLMAIDSLWSRRAAPASEPQSGLS
jgi:signal peptidase II